MNQKQIKLSREELAVQEMDRTTVSRSWRVVLILLFSAGLLSVPIAQVADDLIQYFRGVRDDAIPDALRLAPLWRAAGEEFRTVEGSLFSRVIDANRVLLGEFDQYETRIEDGSWLARTALPAAQTIFTRGFGLGNEKVYLGVDGNLFYRPDIDYVTGPGFLEPEQMHRRRLASTGQRVPIEPDPLPAILAFDRELKERGIRLIVMPIPPKPSMQAAGLYKRYPAEIHPPDNPSYEPFLSNLWKNGIEIFDCRELMLAAENGAFLKQDTHWRPEVAERIAEKLAEKIEHLGILPRDQPVGYTRRKIGAANRGDIAELLRLSPSSNIFGLERVTLQQVLAPDKQLWKRNPAADVLLLGDSFTNIFSIPSLNWGRSAGFAEQLSFYLQRPLDRISFNDNGSFATRRELARRQAAGENPLSKKKLVIWEFAARELSQGDWCKIPSTTPAD